MSNSITPEDRELGYEINPLEEIEMLLKAQNLTKEQAEQLKQLIDIRTRS